MRKRTHIAGTLNVVLSPKWIYTDPPTSNISSQHGEIRNRHDRSRPLTVLGYSQPVVNCRVPTCCVESRSCSHILSVHTRVRLHRLGRILSLLNKGQPIGKGHLLAALVDKILIDQSLFYDRISYRIEQRHVGTGPDGEVEIALNMRRAH